MGVDRDVMQDVEMVDGVTVDPGPAPADEDAARRRRRTRALRLLRRWWPVPLVLVLALVAVQMVQDARGRAVVEQRREVAGVLHRTVDRDLVPRGDIDPNALWELASDIRTDSTTITFEDPVGGTSSLLQAVDADGTVVWTHDFDLPAGEGSGVVDLPSCQGDADPATRVLCLQTDRESVEQDGYWTLEPPSAARLITLDATTGDLLSTEDLPALSGLVVQDGVLYLGSISPDGATLTVAARTALTGEQRWSVTLDVDTQGWSVADLTLWPPSLRADRGHLVVQTITAAWALDPADGSVQVAGSTGLGVSRTGLVQESSAAIRLFDDDGTVLLSESATPVVLGVDDGSVPDLELLVTQSVSKVRTLIAADPRTGSTAWTLERAGWQDAAVVLLDDVLYGATNRSVWAVDARTGQELWSTQVQATANGQVLTDGENLLATTWGPVEGSAGSQYLLTALRLSDGGLLWSTPLPEGVQQVFEVRGELVAFSAEDGSSVILD